MNNDIYITLFKTQERESDRRSKEIEQRKNRKKTHTQTKQGHVTLSTELQSTALTLQPQRFYLITSNFIYSKSNFPKS